MEATKGKIQFPTGAGITLESSVALNATELQIMPFALEVYKQMIVLSGDLDLDVLCDARKKYFLKYDLLCEASGKAIFNAESSWPFYLQDTGENNSELLYQ